MDNRYPQSNYQNEQVLGTMSNMLIKGKFGI